MPEPVLTYDISTNPFPLQASAENVSLTIVATNNTAANVVLAGFTINLPVGTGGGHLTNAAARITALTPEGFDTPEKSESEGTLKFAYENDTEITIRPKQSIVFVFNSIAVNPVTGTAEITIGEVHGVSSRIKKLIVTKFPQGWGVVTFEVANPVIAYNGEAAMNWKGPAGATYTIDYYSYTQDRVIRVPAINEPALANEGRYPATTGSFKLQKRTMFTLTVELEISGVTYKAQNQKTIDVGAPPVPVINSFTASKYMISGMSPETINLSWAVENADTLKLEGDNFASTDVKGETNHNITTNRSGIYKLIATSAEPKSVDRSVQIMSYADFLNYHTFRLAEIEYISRTDYLLDLHEEFIFYNNGKGKYNYTLERRWLPGGMLQNANDESKIADVLEFKWEITNGEVVVNLDAGAHSKAERISFEIRGEDLFYKTAPERKLGRTLNRKIVKLEKQRMMYANGAPEVLSNEIAGEETSSE
jgi:hypothetical protein